MKKTKNNYFGFLVVALIVFGIVALLSLTTMILWNWLMPKLILGLRINILQATGLLALVSILTCDKTKIFGWIYE